MEHRKTHRLRLSVNVSLTEADHKNSSGVMADLSEGGLFLASDAPLPIGTEVFVSIPLSASEKVNGNARVKWIRPVQDGSAEAPAGFGLEWIDLPPGNVEAIRAVIARALEKM
jgi:Tfp pilus assembly protein PilZ